MDLVSNSGGFNRGGSRFKILLPINNYLLTVCDLPDRVFDQAFDPGFLFEGALYNDPFCSIPKLQCSSFRKSPTLHLTFHIYRELTLISRKAGANVKCYYTVESFKKMMSHYLWRKRQLPILWQTTHTNQRRYMNFSYVKPHKPDGRNLPITPSPFLGGGRRRGVMGSIFHPGGSNPPPSRPRPRTPRYSWNANLAG